MDIPGCDYAFSQPSPAGLAAAGLRFAMRYVGPGTADKHLTVAERDEIWAAGLSIVLLAEGTENGALGGFSTGVAHGAAARAGAVALGAPAGLTIYAAVDFNPTIGQWPVVVAYLRGFAHEVGDAATGVYGGLNTVRWAARDQVAPWRFQTYAWSGQPPVWAPGNHVEQYRNGVSLAGGTVDLCRATVADYGQWTRRGDHDMAQIVRDQDTGAYWCTNGPSANHLRTMAEVNDCASLWGIDIATIRNVHTASLNAYGVDVATAGGVVTITDEQLTQVSDAAAAGAEHALDDATVTATIHTQGPA